MKRFKSMILAAESQLTGIAPIRWLVLLPAWIVGRTLWAWGRLRFAALVRDRGTGCVCHWHAELKYPHNIHLGDGVVIGADAGLGAHSPIYIGHRVRISKEVRIETAGLDFVSAPPPYPHVSRAIVIEEGAWIGMRAMILGGVRIGAHAVVAAGSIVTADVPPRALVAGVPARVVRILPSLQERRT